MRLVRTLGRREAVLAVAVGATFAYFAVAQADFLSSYNLQSVASSLVAPGLIACGMTMIIILRGIDVSVGANAALSTVAMGLLWAKAGVPMGVAAAVAVLLATTLGAVNGLIITRLGVPDLVATLATYAIFSGLAQGISGGDRYYIFGSAFTRAVGVDTTAGVPNGFFVLMIAIVVAGVLLGRGRFGREVYAVGVNENAAKFAALNVKRTRTAAYTLTGALAGLAGLALSGQQGTAVAFDGLPLVFTVITAVVVGGVAMSGGAGSIWGMSLGLAFVTLLRNGLGLSGVSPAIRDVVIGCVLIGTVIVNEAIGRRSATTSSDIHNNEESHVTQGAEVPYEVRAFAAGLGQPETPVLLEDGRWAVVEMDPDVCTVTAIAPDGASRQVLAVTDRPNGVAFDHQGRMWVAINSPVPRLARFSADGRAEVSVTEIDGLRLLLPNDLCFGPDGRLWLTDSGIALEELLQCGALRRDWAQLQPDGRLFSVNPQTLRGRLHDRGLAFANGIGISPRGEVHVSETMTGAIHRYRGAPTNLTRELVGNARREDGTADFHGPDGFAFDTDGRIYVAVYGQGHVAVLGSDGTVERRLPTGGALPTNVAFGPDCALYVTEAEHGRLERLPVRATGARVFFGPGERDSMGAREARA